LVPPERRPADASVFDDHAFFFVTEICRNPFPPSNSEWFNYGGDKLWVLPEGNEDEQHWRGNSDLLDDGNFEFQTLRKASTAKFRSPTGRPANGLQFMRTVSLDSDSPRIRFHATMKNASGHSIDGRSIGRPIRHC